MAGSDRTVKNFNTRVVYNSKFVNTALFDRLHIQKLKSLCNNVKSNVLFSDIVKRNIVLNCKNTSVAKSTLSCQNTGTSLVNRGRQMVNKHEFTTAQHGGIESCISMQNNTSVKSVDNVLSNMGGHTDTKEGSNIAQYQSEYAHVNRFAPLVVQDDSSVFDKNSSVTRPHGVDAQVVQTRADEKSKCHKKGKKNSVKYDNINGGLVKDQGSSVLGLNPHDSTQVRAQIHTTVLSEVPTLTITDNVDNKQSSATRDGTDDKYCLEINTSQKSEKMKLAKKAKNNKQFLEQNKPLFGFIPIYGLPSQVYDSNNGSICTDILHLHRQLRNDGRHNFKGLQIGVPSKLNAEVWAQYLANYWDWQLPLLIKYGFPLDFDRDSTLICENISHKSALNYLEYVSTYLREEIENKAILGPFTEPPVDSLHTSPFMTRDKSSLVNRRVKIDLSWPIGNSVNSGVASDKYLDTEFILAYPSIDNVTDQVLKLSKSCEIFKVDISRAFRHVPIDPGDLDLLGLYWNNYFLDCSVPFGFKHGSSIFQRLSDSVRFIMAQEGHNIWNYIDDFCVSPCPLKSITPMSDCKNYWLSSVSL